MFETADVKCAPYLSTSGLFALTDSSKTEDNTVEQTCSAPHLADILHHLRGYRSLLECTANTGFLLAVFEVTVTISSGMCSGAGLSGGLRYLLNSHTLM